MFHHSVNLGFHHCAKLRGVIRVLPPAARYELEFARAAFLVNTLPNCVPGPVWQVVETDPHAASRLPGKIDPTNLVAFFRKIRIVPVWIESLSILPSQLRR